MKITITKKELLRGLKTVSGAAAKGSTLPILAFVRLSASATKLELYCTDLDVSLVTTARVVDVASKGDCAVRVSLLEKIVADVEGDEREIYLETKAGKLEVATESGRYKLLVLDATELPPVPTLKAGVKFKLAVAQFYALFYATSAAQSEDDSRYVLNGCDLELGGKVPAATCVATDGRRLMKMSFPIGDEALKDVAAIVPRKAVAQLLRVLADMPGEADIAGTIFERQAQFKFGEVSLVTKLVDGNFPNYGQVIPQHSKRVILERADFLKSLQRVMRVGDIVRLEMAKNSLRITSKPDKGDEASGSEMMTVLCAEKLRITFNGTYLLDALTATVDVEMALEFADELSPLVLKSTTQDWLAVIMPMRPEQAEPAPNGDSAPGHDDGEPTVEVISGGKSSGKVPLSKLTGKKK